jgi:hypothetical protein
MICASSLQLKPVGGASRLHASRHQGVLPLGLAARSCRTNSGRMGQLRVSAAASSPRVPALTGDDKKEEELKKLRMVSPFAVAQHTHLLAAHVTVCGQTTCSLL